MAKPVKVSTLQKELQRAHNDYENKRQNLSRVLVDVCKNAPVTERLIFGKLGIAESTWASYKKKGIPYAKIGLLVDVLKGLSFDGQPLVN
jgi:hypothetical protein